MSSHEWNLVCPGCRASLEGMQLGYRCNFCEKDYSIEDGVIRFIEADPFYEDRYAPLTLNFSPNEQRLSGRLLLYLMGMHYFWFIRKYVPFKSKLLDLASGAGMFFLAEHYQTAGLDVSFSSAQAMSNVYSLALQCGAGRIPLGDGALDAVVSRFFFEHIPEDEKPEILKECWRLLKPGGWLIVLQDCNCNNPLWRWARRDPELFTRNFIDRDGHIGLLYPSQNLDLFEQYNFRVVEHYAANKTFLVTPSMLEWLQEYRQKNLQANILLRLASLFNRYRLANLGYSLFMTIWDDMVQKYLPLDHARYLLVACQKS